MEGVGDEEEGDEQHHTSGNLVFDGVGLVCFCFGLFVGHRFLASRSCWWVDVLKETRNANIIEDLKDIAKLTAYSKEVPTNLYGSLLKIVYTINFLTGLKD